MARRLPWMLLICLVARSADAMHVRHELTPIAFSDDGAHVLVQVYARGPEGGGSEAFEILSALPPNRAHFEVSSNFSPGDGSRPQKISTAACTQALRDLDRALKARGFREVAVQLDGCKSRGGGYVKTSRPGEDLAHLADWKPANDGSFERDGYRVRRKHGALVVDKGGADLCTMKTDLHDVSELRVAGPKPTRLVVVFASYAYGDSALVGLCGAGPDGKLQPLPIR